MKYIFLATLCVFLCGVLHGNLSMEIEMLNEPNFGEDVQKDDDLDERVNQILRSYGGKQTDKKIELDGETTIDLTAIEMVGNQEIPIPVELKHSVEVGEIIYDEEQLLYDGFPVNVDFMPDTKLSSILNTICSLGDFSHQIVGIDMDRSVPGMAIRGLTPYSALKMVTEGNDLGIYSGANWLTIKPKNPEMRFAKVYDVQHITLGDSGGTTGMDSFGPGFADSESSSISGQSNTSNNSNTSTDSSSSSTDSTSDNANSSSSNGLAQVDLDEDQISDVLSSIQRIIGMIDTNTFTTTEYASGNLSQSAQFNNTGNQGSSMSSDFATYNAEQSIIYAITTERKHKFIDDYLRAVDAPTEMIELDVIVVEHNETVADEFGIDLTNILKGYELGLGSTTGGLSFGTLDNIEWDDTVTLDGTSRLSATIHAFVENTNSEVIMENTVSTLNNQKVTIRSTTNVPVISSVSATSGASGSSTDTGAVDTGGLTNTTFDTSDQEIGTILTFVPRLVGDFIQMRSYVEISNVQNDVTGETLTGRRPTTSTKYSGNVKVENGSAMIIGGLKQVTADSGIGRASFISKVPLLGKLFKKEEILNRDTRVTIIVIPRVTDEDSKRLYRNAQPLEFDEVNNIKNTMDDANSSLREVKEKREKLEESAEDYWRELDRKYGK